MTPATHTTSIPAIWRPKQCIWQTTYWPSVAAFRPVLCTPQRKLRQNLFSASLVAYSHQPVAGSATFCRGGKTSHLTSGLQIVEQGYALAFICKPPHLPPTTECLTEDHLSILLQEVQALLAKEAIQRFPGIRRTDWLLFPLLSYVKE